MRLVNTDGWTDNGEIHKVTLSNEEDEKCRKNCLGEDRRKAQWVEENCLRWIGSGF